MTNERVARRDLLKTIPVAAIAGATAQSAKATTRHGQREATEKNLARSLSTNSEWEPISKLAANDGDADDLFGTSVAVSSDGSTAVIGAETDEDPNGEDIFGAGSAYVFSASNGTWTQEAKLAATEGDGGDRFGKSVAISGDGSRILVGAHRDEEPNGIPDVGAGSAYIFEKENGTWTQQAKLAANDGDPRDDFGYSVALSNEGSTAIIGALGDEDPNGEDAGSVYVFDESGGAWSQEMKLVAEDGESGDKFGFSVAVSGDGTTALVGADGDGFSKGAAYVFDRQGTEWSQREKLVGTDSDTYDQLGFSVALSGDGKTAVVGASADEDPNGEGGGSAYVFSETTSGWSQQTKLAADGGGPSDRFGFSVAVSDSGTTAIIGGSGGIDSSEGTNAGAAHLFTLTDGSWGQQAKFVGDSGDTGDSFGVSVGISGNGTVAIVGANTDDNPNGLDAGSAHVFSETSGDEPESTSEWGQISKMAAEDSANAVNFGTAVDVSTDGTTAIVGATGSAYVFTQEKERWVRRAKLTAEDGTREDKFGNAVAVSGDGTTVIIGAHEDKQPISTNGVGAGSAYVFGLNDGSWNRETKLAADDGAAADEFGISVALSADGTTAVVGADGDDSSQGSAYVFQSMDGTWRQMTKLVGEDSSAGDQFGLSVAMSNDGKTALVGADGDTGPGGPLDAYGTGAAYVFSSADGNWTQQAKLTANDRDGGDRFGTSVALSGEGTTAIIGAEEDEDPNGTTGSIFGGAGSAYVFSSVDGSWDQRSKLAANDGDAGDLFGKSVAMSDDGATVFVGAWGDEDPNGDGAGSAYVYAEGPMGWTQQEKVVPQDGDRLDNFGVSVAVSGGGTIAIVGAEKDEDPNGFSAGSAYAFSSTSGSSDSVTVTGASNPAADLDNDGLYEDVNGDGQRDLFDAVTYYNARDSRAIRSNPGLFDFDGDGTPGTLFDALELYNTIS